MVFLDHALDNPIFTYIISNEYIFRAQFPIPDESALLIMAESVPLFLAGFMKVLLLLFIPMKRNIRSVCLSVMG